MEMKIGIVGCGGISRSHGGAAKRSELTKIVACADVVLSKAEKYASQFDVENAYDSLEAMLKSENLDLVILATWPAQHLEPLGGDKRRSNRNKLCDILCV